MYCITRIRTAADGSVAMVEWGRHGGGPLIAFSELWQSPVVDVCSSIMRGKRFRVLVSTPFGFALGADVQVSGMPPEGPTLLLAGDSSGRALLALPRF